jgi:CyaY protein
MDESTFDKIGRAELGDIEDRLADLDPDEVELTSSDGMLTLALRGGTKVVINTHRAARQIWMAAGSSAWHFDPPAPGAEGWRTSDGRELRTTLADVLFERVGITVALGGPR